MHPGAKSGEDAKQDLEANEALPPASRHPHERDPACKRQSESAPEYRLGPPRDRDEGRLRIWHTLADGRGKRPEEDLATDPRGGAQKVQEKDDDERIHHNDRTRGLPIYLCMTNGRAATRGFRQGISSNASSRTSIPVRENFIDSPSPMAIGPNTSVTAETRSSSDSK